MVKEAVSAFSPGLSLLHDNFFLLSFSEMRLQNVGAYYKCVEHIIRVFPHLERNILNFADPVGYESSYFSSQLIYR